MPQAMPGQGQGQTAPFVEGNEGDEEFDDSMLDSIDPACGPRHRSG